jgi:hypothetical protein
VQHTLIDLMTYHVTYNYATSTGSYVVSAYVE